MTIESLDQTDDSRVLHEGQRQGSHSAGLGKHRRDVQEIPESMKGADSPSLDTLLRFLGHMAALSSRMAILLHCIMQCSTIFVKRCGRRCNAMEGRLHPFRLDANATLVGEILCTIRCKCNFFHSSLASEKRIVSPARHRSRRNRHRNMTPGP